MEYGYMSRDYQDELRDKVAMTMMPMIWQAASDVSIEALKRGTKHAFDIAEMFLQEANERRKEA